MSLADIGTEPSTLRALAYRTLGLAFWGGVFMLYLTPMELGDIWWHLGSGRYILEHMGIPASDPFSITTVAARGEKFVLSAFWLAQIMLHSVQSALGFEGLIALKALVFTATLYISYRLLVGSKGLWGPYAALLAMPLAYAGTFYDEARPQTLSFMFFALALFILEDRRGGPRPQGWRDPLLLLPPTMLVWANMHGGFVLGDLLIAAYVGEAAILRLLSRPKEALDIRLIGLGALSLALSMLNPNGYVSFLYTFGFIKSTTQGTSTIHEHASSASFAEMTGQGGLMYLLIAFTVAVGLSFLMRLGRREPLGRALFHILMFGAMAAMAFVTYRAGMFYMLAGVAVAGENVRGIRPPGCRWLRGAIASVLAMAIILGVVAWQIHPRSLARLAPLQKDFIPYKIADYIELKGLPGNIYHPYEWGGYFLWRLYPLGYKTFADGRAIGPRDLHHDVLMARPGWQATLRGRGVNTVVYWPLLPYDGSVPPIVLAMLSDPEREWVPVYWDLQGLAFVRASLAGERIKTAAVWELLASLIQANIMASPGDARNYAALGEVYAHRGFISDARAAFARAIELDPASAKAGMWMGALKGGR